MPAQGLEATAGIEPAYTALQAVASATRPRRHGAISLLARKAGRATNKVASGGRCAGFSRLVVDACLVRPDPEDGHQNDAPRPSLMMLVMCTTG